MPITPLQREILSLLAGNRSSESYVAGGTVINKSEDSPRFSKDIDIFHDPVASVIAVASQDISLLRSSGFSVEITFQGPGFVRAIARSTLEGVKIEWASDTAFRFFPIVKDEECGFRLHEVDAAINKCIALANRTQVRDLIDILALHQSVIHLGHCCWAACGKDPGFTPDFLLDLLSRNARVTPDLLAAESLLRPIDPKELKLAWINAYEEASNLVKVYNPQDIGCLFLNEAGQVERCPMPGGNYVAHRGSVRGAWPVVSSI